MTNPILSLNGVSKKYRTGTTYAVSDVSFELERGDLLALVGESGSGKTTLLRIIAGLEQPNRGDISLLGQVIVSGKKAVPANQRGIGLLFQDYALFPHLSIFENIAFGLGRMHKKDKEEIVNEMLAVTGLAIDSGRYPHELSGGQQQRVALARALAPKPSLLLLDEPFSNLDIILREQVREEVKEIVRKTGITTILVTHDIKDALSTADKIAVMNKGNLLQFGDPQCIYHQPKDNYVAQLFGKFNILSAEFEDSLLKTNFGSINLQANPRNSSHLPAKKICFRPEQACIISQKDDALVGIVQSCAFCGDRWQLRLGAPNHPDESIFIDCQNNIQPSTGDQIHFKLLDFDHWET